MDRKFGSESSAETRFANDRLIHFSPQTLERTLLVACCDRGPPHWRSGWSLDLRFVRRRHHSQHKGRQIGRRSGVKNEPEEGSNRDSISKVEIAIGDDQGGQQRDVGRSQLAIRHPSK